MKRKINGITLVRVVAVCMILIVHFGQSLPFPSILHLPIVWCQHGVQLFFLISGFLIFKSLDKNSDIKNFYRKRILRIIPTYWTIVALNIIIFDCILNVVPKDEFRIGWLRYFFFLQTFIPTSVVDKWNNLSALWTMSAFAFFYLVAPLFYKAMASYRKACATLGSFMVVGVAFTFYLDKLADRSLYADSLRYLSGKSPIAVLWIFLVGGLIYLMEKRNWGGAFSLCNFNMESNI